MTQEPLARYNPGIQNFILDFYPAYHHERGHIPRGIVHTKACACIYAIGAVHIPLEKGMLHHIPPFGRKVVHDTRAPSKI